MLYYHTQAELRNMKNKPHHAYFDRMEHLQATLNRMNNRRVVRSQNFGGIFEMWDDIKHVDRSEKH